MHICDDHIKVYYNIEKRKLVKIEIEIYRGGGQKFIGGGGGQKWTSTDCRLVSLVVATSLGLKSSVSLIQVSGNARGFYDSAMKPANLLVTSKIEGDGRTASWTGAHFPRCCRRPCRSVRNFRNLA